MLILENLKNFYDSLKTNTATLVVFCLSVVAFTFLYYFVMRFLVKNNSGVLIWIFSLITLVFGTILAFIEKISNELFLIIPLLIVIIVVTLYSSELKRDIWNKSAHKHGEQKRGLESLDEEKVDNCINEIIKALQDMSKNDVGAIIVLANGNIPPQILNSGVKLDSDVSSQLIESVFFPKTPLHDGAMILDGTKIVAAGCFLPLTQQENVPKDMGTRHRAGLGVTESMDVVSIIVSEETGIISVAKAGKIDRYADTELLNKTLKNYYWKEYASSKNKGRK